MEPLLWSLLGLVGTAMLVVASQCLRQVESVVAMPAFKLHPASHRSGALPTPIPRILWSYWHSTDKPLVVQRCVENWARFNPGFSIRMVDADNFSRFVDAAHVPAGFASLSPARQSDWLRLYLLHRHGGIWLDSSIILTAPLDWMLRAQALSQSEYVGFYLDRYTRRVDDPIIDSWCMAAPPGSRFVADWYRELTGDALPLGDDAYLARLGELTDLSTLIQGIRDPRYLIIHVAAQRVLLSRPAGEYRLSLTRAEDSAYFYQAHSRWRRPRLYLRLLFRRHPERPAALIKLRGGERRKLERYLKNGWFRRNSLIGRHLGDTAEMRQ